MCVKIVTINIADDCNNGYTIQSNSILLYSSESNKNGFRRLILLIFIATNSEGRYFFLGGGGGGHNIRVAKCVVIAIHDSKHL